MHACMQDTGVEFLFDSASNAVGTCGFCGVFLMQNYPVLALVVRARLLLVPLPVNQLQQQARQPQT